MYYLRVCVHVWQFTEMYQKLLIKYSGVKSGPVHLYWCE